MPFTLRHLQKEEGHVLCFEIMEDFQITNWYSWIEMGFIQADSNLPYQLFSARTMLHNKQL